MTADRYVIQLNLRNQVVPQYIHLSWTPCHFGSYPPWMLCPYCRRRVARLFKGMGAYTALKDKSGKDVGVVELTQTPGGVLIKLSIKGMPGQRPECPVLG